MNYITPGTTWTPPSCPVCHEYTYPPGSVHRQCEPSPDPKLPRSIYLAGKIGKNDWRHSIVEGLRDAWPGGGDGKKPVPRWPILQKAVGGYFDYTGPYCASDDHGCFHGPCSHGCAECCDGYDTLTREQVRDCCLKAISQSDIIFAWIDDVTGYGTLAEIGYARALGKKIIIASPGPPDFLAATTCHCGGACKEMLEGPFRELWFTFSLADIVQECTDPAKLVLDIAALAVSGERKSALPATASPIEKQFWEAHSRLKLPELKGLVPEHQAGRFRIDFALPEHKIGIELDGFRNHSSTTDIAKDRLRQRWLEAEGWYIIRFGGSEVHRDADGCVRQAAFLVQRRTAS